MEEQAGISLQQVFAAARAAHPDRGVPVATARRADAESAYAGRLFPDSLRLAGFYLDDSLIDDTGFYEDEITLSLPLWLPGERGARRGLAEAAGRVNESAQLEFEWQVSAAVRTALWQLRQARAAWQLSLEQQSQLQSFYAQTLQLEEAGDIARADRLAVLQELATLRAATLNLEAELQDASFYYHALTGLDAAPVDILEARSSAEGVDDQHPALRVALDRVQQGKAALAAVEKGSASRPQLQLFWRETQADVFSDDIGSLGVGVEVPLGRSPQRLPEAAVLNEILALAEAHYLQRKRNLELNLHEAVHQLKVLGELRANSEELLEAARQRYELDQLSRDLGELSIPEWLRRAAAFMQVQRSHESLQLQYGAAIAAYNQAVGESL